MRVALDGRAVGSGLGGDETLARSLLAGLACAAAPEDRFPVLLRRGVAPPDETGGDPRFPTVRVPAASGPVHFGVTLPRALRRLGDVELAFSLIHAPLRSPVPVVLGVTDISFLRCPDLFPKATRLRLGQIIPRQARRSRAVLTISEFCRADIVDAFGIEPERVFVVPIGIHRPAPLGDADRAAGDAWLSAAGVHQPFVLYLGNLHRRKNVARLIRAFTQARRRSPEVAGHQLVLAGARWFPSQAVEEQAALDAADPGSVVVLGRVSEHQRDVLLGSATALAYVSLFEGFGLPPLEAMARDLPVLTSRVAAIPETVADAALLVDPHDLDAITDGLVRMVADADLRDDLRRRGRARVAHFDMLSTGQRALAAFAGAIAGNQPAGTRRAAMR